MATFEIQTTNSGVIRLKHSAPALERFASDLHQMGFVRGREVSQRGPADRELVIMSNYVGTITLWSED